MADYEDSESSDSDGCFALAHPGDAAEQEPFFHKNAFAELGEDDPEDFDDGVLNHFAQWNQDVRSASRPAKSILRNAQAPVTVATVAELDARVGLDARFSSLPTNTKRLNKLLRKTPEQISLENDEVLALIDTGSSIHAADAEVHFPTYKGHVRESSANRRGHAATSAGGHQLANLGKFSVRAETDGQEVVVPFNNMKVKLPILSVRQMMRKGSKLVLEDEGGRIENSRTKQSIRFLIHDGLWYMKLKVQPPGGMRDEPSTSPFGRPGR